MKAIASCMAHVYLMFKPQCIAAIEKYVIMYLHISRVKNYVIEPKIASYFAITTLSANERYNIMSEA